MARWIENPDWTPIERQLAERVQRAVPEDDCPALAEVMALAAQGRRHPAWRERMPHVVLCPACLRAYREAREALAAPRPVWRWPRLPLRWVATAGIAALAALCLMLPRPHEAVTEEHPIVARLRARLDAARDLLIRTDAVLLGDRALPGELAEMVRALFVSPDRLPRIEPPAWWSRALALLSPAPGNAAIVETRPVFRWGTEQGVHYYSFLLESAEEAAPARGAWERLFDFLTHQPWFELPSGMELMRGYCYRWRVQAWRDGRAVRAAESQFRVLRPDEVALVEQARAEGEPVLLAAVYHRLGMYADAVSALAQVRAANPGVLAAELAHWNARQRLNRHLWFGFAAPQ